MRDKSKNAPQIEYPAEKRATIYAIQIVFQLNGEIYYSAAGFFSLLTVINKIVGAMKLNFSV